MTPGTAVRGLEGPRGRDRRSSAGRSPTRTPTSTCSTIPRWRSPAPALAGVGFVATVADLTEDAWRTFDELPSWRLETPRDLLGATA